MNHGKLQRFVESILRVTDSMSDSTNDVILVAGE